MAIWKRKGDGRLAELKWDHEIGKFVIEDRICNDSGEWENVQTNVGNDKFHAIFDLPNMLGGWIAYVKGVGRLTAMAPIGTDYGSRPVDGNSDKYREGLRLLVKLDESLGGTVREFVTTMRGVWEETDKLHDAYLEGVKKHPGCLPVVDIVDVRKDGDRPVLVPIFKINGWVSRPADLPEAGIPIFKPFKKKETSTESASGQWRQV